LESLALGEKCERHDGAKGAKDDLSRDYEYQLPALHREQ